MRQLSWPLLILALIAHFGCERVATVKSPKTYHKDGIHFQHPGNWKVTSDSRRDGVRYLFVETPGQATTAIQIYSGSEAGQIEDFARAFSSIARAEMPKYVVVGNSTFGALEDGGGYKSITEQFSISVFGEEVPHLRFYKQKQFGNSVVNVICQVSNEDEDFVAVGFDQIVSSLKYDGVNDPTSE